MKVNRVAFIFIIITLAPRPRRNYYKNLQVKEIIGGFCSKFIMRFFFLRLFTCNLIKITQGAPAEGFSPLKMEMK